LCHLVPKSNLQSYEYFKFFYPILLIKLYTKKQIAVVFFLDFIGYDGYIDLRADINFKKFSCVIIGPELLEY